MADTTPLLARHETTVKSNVVAGIISTWVATFLAAADTTITSTLSSTIAHEFDSLAIISWLGSGYLIGLTATQPLSGKLSDIFGRRTSFCVATVMFTIGNLLCGFAPSKFVLILARVLAGIGGGGCISIATFVASDHIPLERRGTWQGASALVYTTGMGMGAIIGGSVNDAVGWRWAFIGIAPVSLISCIGVATFLPEHRETRQSLREMLARVDFTGAITLVASLVLLLIGLNHEGAQVVTTQFTITIPLGVLFFAAFLWIEWRWAEEPIIPLSLFRRRTVVAACLTAWFLSATLYTLLYYVPLYMERLGYAPSEIGLRTLPYPVGSGASSFLVGLVIRLTGSWGPLRYVLPLGMVIASGGFTFISLDTHWMLPELYLFCQGAGIAGSLTMLIIAQLHAVPHHAHATATSALYAFRSVGATMGLSAASAIFNSWFGQTPSTGGSSCADSDDCYMVALHKAFLLALLFAIAGLGSALFVETNPLVDDGKGDEPSDY